jgi:hypothetical protein
MTPYLTVPLVLMAALPLLPAQAASPPNHTIELLGRGVQIYTCSAGAAGFGWTLKAPEARLLDAAGQVAGHHFAGPTWQAADGSKVVGAPLVASLAPDAGAVPWLVLHVTEHEGSGRFADVTYITRTRTKGGDPPAGGCDAAHAGAEVRVPYSATYTFFKP